MTDPILNHITSTSNEVDQWIAREKEIYLAKAGSRGTLEGFKAHVAELHKANPEAFMLMLLDAAEELDAQEKRR
jgi:hypothetical protein